jgi:hypothetical protein
MEKIIPTLVSYFEILVLGCLTWAMISYLFATFHPLKTILKNYTVGLIKYSAVFDGTGEKFSGWIKIVTMVGVIYYAGAITNATSYWFLEGTHSRIVYGAVGGGDPADSHFQMRLQMGFLELAGHPFVCLCAPVENHERDHAKALYDDALWRNANADGARASLDHMVRTLRLLRGTVLLAICFGMIALFKVLVSSVLVIFSWIAERTESRTICRVRIWLYVMLVDDAKYQELLNSLPPAGPEAAEAISDRFKIDCAGMRRNTFRYMLAPNLIIVCSAFVVYLIAIGAWQSQEIEFHRLLQYGAKSAVDVLRLETPKLKANDALIVPDNQ